MSKKVRDNIGRGLWAYFGAPEDDYSASAGVISLTRPEFYLSCHKGDMPAHSRQLFASIEELECAMRQIEPDMRKWHLSETG